MRINPRRTVVAKIDMSGSINHQLLLKDARADALRGGLFARQVGVSKKVDTVFTVLFSIEQRQDALLAPLSQFLSGPRAAVPSAAGRGAEMLHGTTREET